MNLSDALERIRYGAQQMNARYGGTVFDEWAVVSLQRGRERIVSYEGPRREDFQKNFVRDLGVLRGEMLTNRHEAGYFDFARHGVGTGFEAFICLGNELYLICNHTGRSMEDITRDRRWLDAQQVFADLTEQFHGKAVVA